MMQDNSTSVLNVEKMDKSFPGVQALDSIDFDLKSGEIHCLVGENGAGKSTFIEILAGKYRPDDGTIHIGDKEFHSLTPPQAIEQGIQTTHQEDHLAMGVSAAENILMGHLPGSGLGLFKLKGCIAEAQKLINSLSLSLDVSKRADQLTPVEQRIVCIARAFSRTTRILILDEPTAALGADETAVLLSMIKEIRDKGIAIIYITHYINEVFEIADRITIFKDGKKVATHERSATNKEEVISEMVGRKVGSIYSRPEHTLGETVLQLKELSQEGVFNNISFDLKEGEIFGIGGLIGSGRTELMRTIFGLDKRDNGDIFYNGIKVDPSNPKQAIVKGFGFLTEDRKKSGLIMGRPVKENINIVNLSIKKPVFLNLPEEERRVLEIVDKLRIATPSVDQLVMNLSGGNQQKVVLSKWLLSGSTILIFDEPTIGVDVGAKAEIYALMHELTQSGKSIIMISSDIIELLTLSDRIGIMRRGEMVKILEQADMSEETILQYITGVKA
jgi:ribose transport system ATP-binding protein